MVGTVGQLTVIPGAINIIPGHAELYCELRATDDDTLQTAWNEFVAELEAIAAARQTPLQRRLTEVSPPVPMAESVRHTLQTACSRLQIPCMDMASGAGHDCMNMASITSAGMLFVRSRNGLSHHPDEFVRPCDVQAGYQALFDTLSAPSPAVADFLHNEPLLDVYQAALESVGETCVREDPVCLSTDAGNVSYEAPSIHPLFTVGCPEGVKLHAKAFAEACTTDAAWEHTLRAAFALSATGYMRFSLSRCERRRTKPTQQLWGTALRNTILSVCAAGRA